MDPV
ncbi:Nlpc/p60 superfamily protein, partial [Monkeypox virus]|jgi:hypothetical protein